MTEMEPGRLPLVVRTIIKFMEVIGGDKIAEKSTDKQSSGKAKIFKRKGIVFRRHQQNPHQKP